MLLIVSYADFGSGSVLNTIFPLFIGEHIGQFKSYAVQRIQVYRVLFTGMSCFYIEYHAVGDASVPEQKLSPIRFSRLLSEYHVKEAHFNQAQAAACDISLSACSPL